MDPASATTASSSSASAWRRRRSQSGAGVLHLHAAEDRDDELGCRRSSRVRNELEATVARLRAEKETAERAAAALRAELESERGAAATAATEVMLMIARLQREKAAATIEARALRRVAETRAGRVRELQDRLAGAHHALAAPYQTAAPLLRGGGIDDFDGDDDHESDHHEQHEAGKRAAAAVEYPPPPPAAEEFEDKYAVDVTTKPVAAAAGEEDPAAAAGGLRARVEALEADGAAVRREVAALREVVLARQVYSSDDKQSFSVIAIFKRFFSTILRGIKRSAASAARVKLPNIIGSSSPMAFLLLLGLLPLLERSNGGTLRIHSKTTSRHPAQSHSQSHGLEYYSMLCYSF